MSEQEFDPGEYVAVIGMTAKFPGASNLDEYWANLIGGVESITVFPTDEPVDHVPSAGVVQDADRFDAAFFGCSPAEALILDPQHRLFLECAWEALEDAGCNPSTYRGAIGVYGGSTETGYLERLHAVRDQLPAVSEFQLRIATGVDFLTSRVAYKLGLRGPAVTVQTACSTSLVAVHLASQALLGGECDMALAGGATVTASPEPGDYDEGGIVSQDGHCRTFDAAADGTVTGSGVGIVVLKRLPDALADGDQIRAVLLGSAVNNDASVKVGFTAPGVDGQADVIRAAQLVAQVPAESITYVEAHGTATPLGDPIELAALTKAFRDSTDRVGFCLIGSVKTNIGHADAAAGVAGFIKTVLALEHGQIPPSLHFDRPNPQLELESSPFAVNTELTEWKPVGFPRRAGVSAFGIGGTNAHTILEEPPARYSDPSGPRQLLVLSARTRPALEAATSRLAQHLQTHPEQPLADVAWTLQSGRKAHAHRRILVCDSPADAVQALNAPSAARVISSQVRPAERPVVFLFPGQGGQHVGMGRELYDTQPVFRREIDRACDLATPHLGIDLRTVLYPPIGDAAAAKEATAQIGRMSVGQPAVFMVEYALARLWMHWGVTPAAVVGHSLGAYAAACLSGVLSLADAVQLVVGRGELLDSLPAGAMLAVPLPERELLPLLDDELSVAVINGPTQSVVSGPATAINRLQAQLTEQGLDVRRLNISTAGHSSVVDPIVPAFESLVAQLALSDPGIPFVSDTTGNWTATGELTEAGYWTAHLRNPVRFSNALETLLAAPDRVLLEVGPGRTLAALARQHPALGESHQVVNSLPHPSETTSPLSSMLTAAGRLWLAGVAISWPGFYQGERRNKVRLPTYPFQRQRFLIEPPAGIAPSASAARRCEIEVLPELDDSDDVLGSIDVDAGTPVQRTLKAIFRRVLGVGELTVHDSFFDIGGDSLIAAQLMAMVSKEFSIKVTAKAIYRAPTVGALAELVEAALGQSDGPAAPSPPVGRLEDSPAAGASGRWLACRERRPEATFRLYCFPHSGGSAGEFVRWADSLPDVEVFGLQLPGRGTRLNEPAFTEMKALIAAITAQVDFDGPFAFFGHSLGALVAFEVARVLRDTGRRQPERIFASACPAPHLPRLEKPIHQLSDTKLAAWIDEEYGSMPAEIMADRELLQMVIPAHRADFEIVETYEYRAGAPLDIPITVIGGTEDELPEPELAAWGRHSESGSEVELLPGGHFYLREQQDRLLQLVSDRLTPSRPEALSSL